MKKILFLIHDLGPGGAEKVLVNLVNHMDREKFDITVMSLFDVGVNRQYLAEHIHYRYCFKKMVRGNSHLMKLLTPAQLHRWLIKDRYDIEVAYLEGPSTRIISGCPHGQTRLYSWVHCLPTRHNVTLGYRSYAEALRCYRRFDKVICVSETAREGFARVFPRITATGVLYNTNDSCRIRQLAQEPVEIPPAQGVRLVAAGRLTEVKAFDRLIRIHARLRSEGYPVQTLILGTGALEQDLKKQAAQLGVADTVIFAGYQTNPYAYVAKSDLFVCCSLSEGFSTAATEALIVGTPVCTVEVSGMREMLGNNRFGIVTENSEQALYEGLRKLLDDPVLLQHYKKKAAERGMDFNTENTVTAVERMLEGM